METDTEKWSLKRAVPKLLQFIYILAKSLVLLSLVSIKNIFTRI